ncbi:hypothetical protein GCM10023205_76650 [Yinghuangia aomiensis]|uniref:Uncharacterized protein n=1 Tax=Yinghuangia aomiensis TaxID=676205 RepID=A0ABP9I9Q2_9ACTN
MFRLTSAAAVGAGLAVGVAGAAEAAPTRAGQFVLTGKRSGANIPNVLTPGAGYFVHYDLTDANGKAAGTENAFTVPVTVGLDGALVVSTLVLVLNDGQITANAAFQRPLPSVTEIATTYTPWSHTFAVTGGTGTYVGASGTITIDHPTKDDDKLTIDLK